MLEMRRLPAEEMLDQRLQMGPPPSTVEIGAVASRLLRFYRETLRPAGAGQGYLRRWQREGAVNARHLDQMRHLLGPAYDPGLGPTALDLIDACTDEILARARRGLIVEGHGDLRPEHVCLTDPPVIFDRLEFDPLLRLADPFDETGMLGQDCAAMGAGWIGSVLRGRLTTAGLPEPSPRLRLAYAVNRCLTRARLAIDHLREPAMRTPEKWPRQARSQIERATRLLASEP
jgi:aminoglycoside phosphotransferase family enzyme